MDSAETTPCICPNTKERFSYQIQQDDDFVLEHYNHFPMILNSDGSLSEHANLFMLDRLKSVKRVLIPRESLLQPFVYKGYL